MWPQIESEREKIHGSDTEGVGTGLGKSMAFVLGEGGATQGFEAGE